MISQLDRPETTTVYQGVFRAESQHLQSVGERRSRLGRGFTWTIAAIALISFAWTVIDTIPQWPSLLLWLLYQFNLTIPDYYINGGANDTLLPFTLLFPLCVLMWDLWLTVRTLAMSSNTITRERNAKSWELLLLTDVNVRQVVRAKWWAVIRQQWRDYAQLAIMRMGAVGFLALNISVTFSFGRFPYFSYGSQGPVVEPDRTIVFLIATLIVLLSAAIIAVLTMLNLMFTAACGIVGGCITQRASLTLPSAIAVRLLLAIMLAALIGIPGYLGLKPDIENFGYYPNPVLSTIFLILGLTGATMADTGIIASGLLMRFGYYFRWYPGFDLFSDRLRAHGSAFLTALLLSILIYVILTRLVLRRAEKIIARQSVE